MFLKHGLFNKTISYTPSDDEEIKVYVKNYNTDYDYHVMESYLSIYTKKDVEVKKKTMEYWVEKLINNIYSNTYGEAPYTLSEESKGRLRDISA